MSNKNQIEKSLKEANSSILKSESAQSKIIIEDIVKYAKLNLEECK